MKALLKRFYLNGNTIGFSSTDSKEKSQTNREQSCFAGRGLTIVGSILEGDFNERAEDVALAKEVKDNCKFSLGAALVANNNRSDKFESILMIPLRSATAVVLGGFLKFKLLKCIWLLAGLAHKSRILFGRNQIFQNAVMVHFSL